MKKATINIASPRPAIRSIFVIYTGGTLGMSYDESGKHLIPFDFDLILENIPELRRFEYELTVLSLPEIIDSSNMRPQLWIEIAEIIEAHYQDYDGFIILHGTDTMAYTASALSFLLENLAKPVILTGAQLPVGSVRTDAHRNLVTSIQIAAAQQYGYPMVPEVCIYFDDVLLRGNRARKLISNRFDAFHSENYPVLARAGIHVDFQTEYIREPVPGSKLKVQSNMKQEVAILKLFPGISEQMVACWLSQPTLKGLVLETFGSGNAPTDPWFLGLLEEALNRGVLVMNVSQCYGGKVEQGRYATSQDLEALGVISGEDITPEAAITKLMYLLARDCSPEERKRQLAQNLRGEMSRANI